MHTTKQTRRCTQHCTVLSVCWHSGSPANMPGARVCICPTLLTYSSRNQPCKPSRASLQRLAELLGHTMLVCRYLTNYYSSRRPPFESSHTPPTLHVAVSEMSARILCSNEPDALELRSVSTQHSVITNKSHTLIVSH